MNGFGGGEPLSDYEAERAVIGAIVKGINSIHDMSLLNGVEQVWEERMKTLAAEILQPGKDFTLEECEGHLYALDYIWGLGGDRCISGDQIYHRSALDYYLGRKVSHVWGDGVLVRFIRSDEEWLDRERTYFGDGLWISDPLRDRGYHHGIALKYPCTCGKVEYQMFAIPGVHTGGFAYLICEEYDNLLDVRNQCRVCEECAPKVEAQLAAIDRGEFDIEEDGE